MNIEHRLTINDFIGLKSYMCFYALYGSFWIRDKG